jgi:hypothetical protein
MFHRVSVTPQTKRAAGLAAIAAMIRWYRSNTSETNELPDRRTGMLLLSTRFTMLHLNLDDDEQAWNLSIRIASAAIRFAVECVLLPSIRKQK